MIPIEVACPPEEAFSFVARDYFENHARWDPDVIELRKLTEGPVGVGTRGQELRRFGTTQRIEFEVTEYVPGRRLALRDAPGIFFLHRSYDFEPLPRGTRVTFTFSVSPRTLPGRLLLPVISRLIRRTVTRNIAGRLKALLDSRAP